MQLYAMYLRKSRADEQAESMEETLLRHKKMLGDYMMAHSITVYPEDIYEEVVSGDSLYNRPQMLRLLEAVEAGKYAAVLCVDIQRLGRGSMRDQGIILDAFKFSSTLIITPARTYDLSNEMDETNTELETFMGRQELKMIKRRLHNGRELTYDYGGYLSNAPYGYRKTRVKKIPTLEIVEEEARFVRLMFDLYVNRGMGCQRIADTINAMGARPHRTQEFGRTSVMAILRNPTYIGLIPRGRRKIIKPKAPGGKIKSIYSPPSKWTIIPGVHPPILDENIFNAAQTIADGRYHPPSNTGIIENPLSGLVFCRNCGQSMTRAANMRGGPYLLCVRRGCMVSSKLEYVEQAVVDQLKEYLLILPTQQAAEENSKAQEIGVHIKAIDDEIKAINAQVSRLHDLLEQGVYDTGTFRERRRLLMEKLEKSKQAREQLYDSVKVCDTASMCENIKTALDAYPRSTPAQRNALLRSVIQRIIYYKAPGAKPAEFELEITLHPIFK